MAVGNGRAEYDGFAVLAMRHPLGHHVAHDPDPPAAEAAPHDHEADEQNALLQRAMQALDPMSRALVLMHLDARSHREIAEVLGISESNVATKFSRIKHRLRAALADA